MGVGDEGEGIDWREGALSRTDYMGKSIINSFKFVFAAVGVSGSQVEHSY